MRQTENPGQAEINQQKALGDRSHDAVGVMGQQRLQGRRTTWRGAQRGPQPPATENPRHEEVTIWKTFRPLCWVLLDFAADVIVPCLPLSLCVLTINSLPIKESYLVPCHLAKPDVVDVKLCVLLEKA